MRERQKLEPTSDHPITIRATNQPVVVRRGGIVIADTVDALTLREAAYPPVHYIPFDDVDEGAIRPSSGQTYCPFKGDATYYAIVAGGPAVEDAVWCYEEPFEFVAEIAGRLAFYPQNVEIDVGENIADG